MKIYPKLALTSTILIFIFALIYLNSLKHEKVKRFEGNLVTIAVVVCGFDRIDESLTMIKSALLYPSQSALNFVVITEEELQEIVKEKLENFRIFKQFSYEIVNLKFPKDDEEMWIKLFKPCASQRLFLPSLLPGIDSLIYVDCDIIFLSPPELLNRHFKSFDEHQISAMTSESESKNTGWYTRFARHPFYGTFGVNSGVMLMNLTRMRSVQFEEEIHPIYQKFKNQLAWGDQDLINIYFHDHPERLHLMKCEFNYRPDHCMYMAQCLSDEGVKVVHGNRGYFKKEGQQSVFREIFKAIEEYQFTDDPCTHIVELIENDVMGSDASNCNDLFKDFLRIPKKLFCKKIED